MKISPQERKQLLQNPMSRTQWEAHVACRETNKDKLEELEILLNNYTPDDSSTKEKEYAERAVKACKNNNFEVMKLFLHTGDLKEFPKAVAMYCTKNSLQDKKTLFNSLKDIIKEYTRKKIALYYIAKHIEIDYNAALQSDEFSALYSTQDGEIMNVLRESLNILATNLKNTKPDNFLHPIKSQQTQATPQPQTFQVAHHIQPAQQILQPNYLDYKALRAPERVMACILAVSFTAVGLYVAPITMLTATTFIAYSIYNQLSGDQINNVMNDLKADLSTIKENMNNAAHNFVELVKDKSSQVISASRG